MPAAPALAATINVANGGCTLIDAIKSANTDTATGLCPAGNGADTVVLPANSTQSLATVQDSSRGKTGLPVITSTITLQANGSTLTRAPGSPNFRILFVDRGGNLTLDRATVSGGSPTGNGFDGSCGGIFVGEYAPTSTLTLSNSTVTGNSAAGNGGGLCVRFNGNARVMNSTVSGNTARYGVGGGIVSFGGPAMVVDSTVSGNTAVDGGGIHSQGSVVDLVNGTVADNSATRRGGGAFATSGGQLNIVNSTISGNRVNDGPYSGFGGGIAADYGVVSVSNSTLTGNMSSYAGGGLDLYRSTTTLTNSVVSGNTAGTRGREVSYFLGTVTANQFNLFGHSGITSAQALHGFTPGTSDRTATSDGTTPTALSDILDTVLDNNGGPTKTHALVFGSPAIDAVVGSCVATDQRGIARPQDGNASGTAECDIGAYELVAMDTTPNAFVFMDQTNVPRNSVRTSNAVTITGIDTAAPISVLGGGYSIGCTGTFTTAPGTITSGQTVCVRHTSAPTFNAGRNTILTVGGVSDTFTSVTTKSLVQQLLGVVFQVIAGAVGAVLGLLGG
ncbi:MAG: choice-of-anchor Q domain-containing protein [Panacagrimonas sp.]